MRHVTLTGDKHEQVMWSLRMTIWLYFRSRTLSCLTLGSFIWCTASSSSMCLVFTIARTHFSILRSLFSKFFTQRVQHQCMWIIYHCFGTKCIHWRHVKLHLLFYHFDTNCTIQGNLHIYIQFSKLFNLNSNIREYHSCLVKKFDKRKYCIMLPVVRVFRLLCYEW